MLAISSKNELGSSHLSTSLSRQHEPSAHNADAGSPSDVRLANGPNFDVTAKAHSATRNGILMQCAAHRSDSAAADEAEEREAQRISEAVLKSLEDNLDGSTTPAEGSERRAHTPAMYATYPGVENFATAWSGGLGLPSEPITLSGVKHGSPITNQHLSRTVEVIPRGASASPFMNFQCSPVASPKISKLLLTPQMGRVLELGTDFNAMCEHIWKYNDQKTSLFLQERLRYCVPGEYERLASAVFDNALPLMVHRFGNFLVQCMLELAKENEIAAFASLMEGRVAHLSKDQFCCHVIQRLLDVSPVVIQATVAAELLDDVIGTMCSASGSHVWQKLLHLPWQEGIPPITELANNAVHLKPNQEGWLTIAKTEAGCATIKSFLGVSSAGSERQECLDELVDALDQLIVDPIGSVLAARVAMIAASRARAFSVILSRAYEYAKHPVASGILVTLLHYKIPSFPTRLGSALAPFRSEISNSQFGKQVLAALELTQGRK